MPAPPLSLLRTQSDERLVELARAGHERAFEAIVQRYRKPLLRACRRYLPEARAEDALQQALLAAWTALQRGDEVRELRPWLYRIAHNTSLNTVRMSGYDHAELADSLRATDAPDEELERRAIVRQTLAGVAALPERQREALLRMALEGAGAEEVARDLGLSTGAVRQLVHRARMTLRAAATAITPLPLAGWAAGASGAGDGFAQRIAELCAPAATAGAGATVAKVGAVAVLAGGAVAGPVAVHHDAASDRARAATVRQQEVRAAARSDRPAASESRGRAGALGPQGAGAALVASTRDGHGGDDKGGHRGHGRGGSDDRGDDDGGRQGRGRGGDGGGGSSGPGSGGGGSGGEDRSGSSDRGSGGDDDDDRDSSGSGSSGSSGSGSGSSGSGKSGSGSGSGSGGSGSGRSGSGGSGSSGSGSGGSDDDGFDSSGSGSSGSGSGSGSGDDDRVLEGSGSGSSGSGGVTSDPPDLDD